MEIVFTRNRDLNTFDEDIKQYYKDLAEIWNRFEKFLTKPTDGRRPNYNFAYNEFFDKLLYLWDMIKQTEKQHLEEVEKLKKELNKWTANQNGRKPKLTDKQKEEIRTEKAESKISNKKLAKKYGVSEGTIRNVLKERKLDAGEQYEINFLYNQDPEKNSYSKLAKKFDVTKGTIAKAIYPKWKK